MDKAPKLIEKCKVLLIQKNFEKEEDCKTWQYMTSRITVKLE